ncbi:MAG: hypothetical protein VX730_07655 [Pseudomonadota bacterium]|nr:hypothetical protein [Pseudomonadota bacterium]
MTTAKHISFEELTEILADPFECLFYRHAAHVVHMMDDPEMEQDLLITMLDSSYSDILEDAFTLAKAEVEVAQEQEGGPIQFAGNKKAMLQALEDAMVEFTPLAEHGEDFLLLTQMQVDGELFSLGETHVYQAGEHQTVEIIDHKEESHTFDLQKGNVIVEDSGVFFVYDLSEMGQIGVTAILSQNFDRNIFSDISDHRMFMVYELLDRIEEGGTTLEVSLNFVPEAVIENLVPADVLGEPLVLPDEETLTTPELGLIEQRLRTVNMVTNDTEVLENFHTMLGHHIQFVSQLADLKWKYSQAMGDEGDGEDMPEPTHMVDKTMIH